MRSLFSLAVVFLFFSNMAAAEIHKCKDINGQLHFADDRSKLDSLCANNAIPADSDQKPKVKQTLSSLYLNLTIGNGWKFSDEKEFLSIIVSKIVNIKGKDYYLVEWSRDGMGVYQSEYWLQQNDGIYVAGRNVFGSIIMFDKPYLLIKHDAEVGMQWSDKITTKGLKDEMHTSVEARENIDTPLGTIAALKVVTIVKGIKIERWYGKNVGLVRIVNYANLGDSFVKTSENNIVQAIDEASLQQLKAASQRPVSVENISTKWFFYDFDSKRPNIVSWDLLADGTFTGDCRDSEPFWNFKGNWWLKDGKLYSKITWSSLKIKQMDADSDEIIELTSEYMLLNDGSHVRKFWSKPNGMLEMQLMFKVFQAAQSK